MAKIWRQQNTWFKIPFPHHTGGLGCVRSKMVVVLLLIYCLMFLPLLMRVLCLALVFVMPYLLSFLFFNCLFIVLWLLVFCSSSSRCHVLVCSVRLWYFLSILTVFLKPIFSINFKWSVFRNLSFLKFVGWYFSLKIKQC